MFPTKKRSTKLYEPRLVWCSCYFVDRLACPEPNIARLVAPAVPNKIESSFRCFRLSENMFQTAPRLLRLVIRGGLKLVRDPSESTLILRMAAWVSILSLLVKFRPLPRALQMVSLGAPRDRRDHSGETQRRLARAIDLLLGTKLLVFKPICWKRAAILHRYLALHGIATRIVFGMRQGPDGAVDGHAWLEIAGKPILESKTPNYKVTYAFPSRDVCNLDLSSLTSPPTIAPE